MKSLSSLIASAMLTMGGVLLSHAAEAPVKQGAELLKTDIMGVFAHPDDETGVASTLAAYGLGRGKVVANVYCTRGEGGGNMVGRQWGESLGVLREAELRDCLNRIGVRYCYFLDQRDFFYTESVSATMEKWGKERTLERLVRLVRGLRPEVIVTMNPAPTPGQHGHHQAAAVLATEAFDAAADPKRFPEQLTKEGLSVWQVRKLYHGGGGHGHVAKITVTDPLPGGRTPAELAGEALANHRSQAFGNFGNSPWMRRPQSFTLVKTVVPFVNEETDLLRGLPVTDAAAKRQQSGRHESSDQSVTLRFIPRPAISGYQAWTKAQGIEDTATELSADVPVVAGEENTIKLEIRNSGVEDSRGQVDYQAPAGWTLVDASCKYAVKAGQTETIHLKVRPPATATMDAQIKAMVKLGGKEVSAVVSAHPVPSATVAKIKTTPRPDATGAGWEGISALGISHTNLVQGKSANAADSSANFRVAHDGRTLFVEVDVADDKIVSNIAPDDIRGHWRSDSVEICIDPAAGAENTVHCFKLAIFPFDQTGVVRGARDADANQGPVEETAPGTRITSQRTAAGYRVQAAIPFKEIGMQGKQGKRGQRFGFNVIVYDGDKADAATGENINKSRIAWAPRSGVMGRPEDWGRMVLK